MEIHRFPERYKRAVRDDALRQTLRDFQRNWRASRDRAVSEMDFDSRRQKLAAIKDDVIDHLPEYVDKFAATAEAHGAIVFRAAGAEDAVAYIANLVTERQARVVVKSKSMVSEEIELNESLEAAGARVVETDLGEWIVQLAGERPSHIIGPALHKNRRQVADLFAGFIGRPVNREDIGEQVAVAREALREEFLAGDIGISGANALIVETGGIMLVTNEGNAELVTSLPPVHVVLAGVEKLVPTLDDAMTQLSLLAPSATGQPATSYVSFIAPPVEPGRQLHIVLLDNGRNAMRQSDLFKETLRCIRCGACSSVCPSYGIVGGHVFGHIYSGAIGLVNTPFHHGLDNDAGPQGLCVSCNACQAVCPVDIPLPRQILDTRAAVVERHGLPAIQRVALDIWSRPSVFRVLARISSKLQRPFQRGAFLVPPGMKTLTSWRKPPALASHPFRDRWDSAVPHPVPGPTGQLLSGVRVAYFVQCLTDWLYPEMGKDILEVLGGLGATVEFPASQHCCGLPAMDSGSTEAAIRMARQTIETLEKCQAEFIVTGGTSCAVAIVHDYPHLFRDDPQWRARAESIASRTFDFTTFMLRVARVPDGALSTRRETATYHYFCQSYNVLKFREEPLHLLRDVCGVELAPLPEGNVCCGFGGSVSMRYPEMCAHILDRKLNNLDTTGSRLLITDNPGCIMHLRGGIAASDRNVTVKHTAEIIAERVRDLRPDPAV
jgi:L-lactate dehydrogenase complex protein LldF